jgi:hypothetical protein
MFCQFDVQNRLPVLLTLGVIHQPVAVLTVDINHTAGASTCQVAAN